MVIITYVHIIIILLNFDIARKPDDTSHVLPRPIPQLLEVGSMVQFGDPVEYGVIKQIRKDSHSNEEFAEIELVSNALI